MLNVDPANLKVVQEILKKYVPELQVRAFGSRVTGQTKPYSDLDLTIIGQNKLDREILINLKQAFQESRLPFRVDVIDWHQISTEFQNIIDGNYVVISNNILSQGG